MTATDPGPFVSFTLSTRGAHSVMMMALEGLLSYQQQLDTKPWPTAILDLLDFAALVDTHAPHGKYVFVDETREAWARVMDAHDPPRAKQ